MQRLSLPVHRRIDHTLRVLHAKAHREAFCLHRNPPLLQHCKRIPRTVSDRQNDSLRFEKSLRCQKTPAYALLDHKIRHPRSEEKRGAVFLQILVHPLDHRHQHIRPDVRLIVVQNFLRRTETHKCLEHVSPPPRRVPDPGV